MSASEQMIRVRCFAGLRDIVGDEVVELSSETTTVGRLRAAIARQIPALASRLATARIAVNLSFADDDHPVAPGDEIALIPPVSGG